MPSNGLLNAVKFILRGDVMSLSLTSFSVLVKHSKMNQFVQRELVLPFVACADVRLCPVRALLANFGGSTGLMASRPLFNYIANGKEVQFTHALLVKRSQLGLRNTAFAGSNLSCHRF